MSDKLEALKLARPIVEADYHAAKEQCDADWEGMSFTALEAIDAALRTPTPEACESCDGSGVDLYDGNPGKDCQTCSGRGSIAVRTPTPDQAGEVEQIIRWVDQAIERADKHSNTEGMWLFAKQWKAVRAALQSTPPAQPTARIERALHKAAISSSKHVYDAQPTADAVERALNDALYLAVATLAFHGRDRGTDRQDGMLDGLEEIARKADPAIRAALAALPTMSGDYVMVPREALTDLIDETVALLTPKGNAWTGNEADWQVNAYAKATAALDMLSAASPTGGE